MLEGHQAILYVSSVDGHPARRWPLIHPNVDTRFWLACMPRLHPDHLDSLIYAHHHLIYRWSPLAGLVSFHAARVLCLDSFAIQVISPRPPTFWSAKTLLTSEAEDLSRECIYLIDHLPEAPTTRQSDAVRLRGLKCIFWWFL